MFKTRDMTSKTAICEDVKIESESNRVAFNVLTRKKYLRHPNH